MLWTGKRVSNTFSGPRPGEVPPPSRSGASDPFAGGERDLLDLVGSGGDAIAEVVEVMERVARKLPWKETEALIKKVIASFDADCLSANQHRRLNRMPRRKRKQEALKIQHQNRCDLAKLAKVVVEARREDSFMASFVPARYGTSDRRYL